MTLQTCYITSPSAPGFDVESTFQLIYIPRDEAAETSKAVTMVCLYYFYDYYLFYYCTFSGA